jgi:hypothetical protein
MGRKILSAARRYIYNPATLRTFVTAGLFALVALTAADAQTRRRPEPKTAEPPIPAVPLDKRDSVVPAPGPFAGRPYWLALAQCGGIYFKLNVLYTEIAVRARAVKPDPKINAEFTKKLTEAIKTATSFFDGAEHFLMIDRGIERIDAVLIYDAQSHAVADRLKTIDAALTAAKVCPALYQACEAANAKACGEALPPLS